MIANDMGMKNDPVVKRGQQVLDYITCSERENLLSVKLVHFKIIMYVDDTNKN